MRFILNPADPDDVVQDDRETEAERVLLDAVEKRVGPGDYKEAQRARREKRLPIRQAAIESLRVEGFKVEEKNYGYHYRINDCLDIWPIHNRYHDLKRNLRGGFKEVKTFVRSFFRKEN